VITTKHKKSSFGPAHLPASPWKMKEKITGALELFYVWRMEVEWLDAPT
jgi:hypothetical protein